MRYIWVLLNITCVWNPTGFSRPTPSNHPFANHPLPTPLNLVLADNSGRYGYYGLHWHFCVHLDSSLFFRYVFPSFEAELTASPSDFESKHSPASSLGLVIELDCTIRTFIRSLTAFLILASKGFIREGPRARILLAR